MIVKLTFKKQKLFQSPSVNNQAFQKFINLCHNEYGEQFLVRDRTNDTCVFTFRVQESADALRTRLEQAILPQSLPGSWKKDSYVLVIEEENAPSEARAAADVPVYKPPMTATPAEPKKPEPAPKKPEPAAKKPEPVPKKPEGGSSDGRTPTPDMDALREFLAKQGQGGPASPEKPKTTDPIPAPKKPEPAPKKPEGGSSDGRTPTPDMDALRDFLAKQGQGGTAAPEKPKAPEPAPKKPDPTPAGQWHDDRTPRPDMDALRAFLAEHGTDGKKNDESEPQSEPVKQETGTPAPEEPKTESTGAGEWHDDRTPRPDMDALRAFLARQGQGGDDTVEITDESGADSPVKEGEVEDVPGGGSSIGWSAGGEVIDVDAVDVTDEDEDEEDEIVEEDDKGEESTAEPKAPVDISGLLETLTAHLTARSEADGGKKGLTLLSEDEGDGSGDSGESTGGGDFGDFGSLDELVDAIVDAIGDDDDDIDDAGEDTEDQGFGGFVDFGDVLDSDEDEEKTENSEEIVDFVEDDGEGKSEKSAEIVDTAVEDDLPFGPMEEKTENSEENVDSPVIEPDNETLKEIFDLVGAHAFIELCKTVHSRAHFIRAHNTKKVFLSDAYLFAINRGEGFSRALELFSALMVEEGIIEQKEINELTPPPPTDRELEDRMNRFLRNVESVMEASRTLSLDISEWIGRTGSAAFKKLLLHVFQRAGNTLVVFRIPCVSQNLIAQTKKDLDDIMITKAVIFEPFTQEELRTFATMMLGEYGFSAADSVWPYYDRKVMDEKRDGYFYGLHTIRKITNAMIRRAEEQSISTGESTTVIMPEMVEDWIPQQEDGADAMAELDALVGMETVKQQILEIVNQIRLSRMSGGKQPCMHMAFVGSAGTGKTTVARILGKMLKEMGILRIGNFYEHTGRDLCGRYVGETAIKTTAICQEAYGSVLFIDEAYSLFRGDFSTVDYGREAIDTLIAEMENHRDDMLVIFAGYTHDMDILMTANAGMESRVPYRINFPNYEPETLSKIFLHMVGESFTYDESLEKAASDYFMALPPERVEAQDFGNARFVRNLFERVWGKAAMRCTDTRLEDLCITAQDFAAAVDSMESTTKKKKTKKPIGFN